MKDALSSWLEMFFVLKWRILLSVLVSQQESLSGSCKGQRKVHFRLVANNNISLSHKRPSRLKFRLLAPCARSPIVLGYIEVCHLSCNSSVLGTLSSSIKNWLILSTIFNLYRCKSLAQWHLTWISFISFQLPFRPAPGLTDHPGFCEMTRIQSITKIFQK